MKKKIPSSPKGWQIEDSGDRRVVSVDISKRAGRRTRNGAEQACSHGAGTPDLWCVTHGNELVNALRVVLTETLQRFPLPGGIRDDAYPFAYAWEAVEVEISEFTILASRCEDAFQHSWSECSEVE